MIRYLAVSHDLAHPAVIHRLLFNDLVFHVTLGLGYAMAWRRGSLLPGR
jgi:hypothetical protein